MAILITENILVVRSLSYAKDIRRFVKFLPWNPKMEGDIKQLLRSSGSVGANYLEAQQAESRKDFLHKVRICRKEIYESYHWLQLLRENIDEKFHGQCDELIRETYELMSIFTSICKKVENKK